MIMSVRVDRTADGLHKIYYPLGRHNANIEHLEKR